MFWSVTYLHRRYYQHKLRILKNIFSRLKGLNYSDEKNHKPRKRSNSLPIPKIEVTEHDVEDKVVPERLPNILESRKESYSYERYQ